MIIYKLTCRTSGKAYIGLTSKTLDKRWKEHCAAAVRGVPFALYAAMRKHGVDCWHQEVLETCQTKALAAGREKVHIEQHATLAMTGYNMTRGGDGVIGAPWTPERKAKLRASLAGRPLSMERRAKISATLSDPTHPAYGRKQSAEVKVKMSLAQVGSVKPKGPLAKCAKTYWITPPGGEEFQIVGLTDFARQNGLSRAMFSAVLAGRVAHYKGWAIRRAA